MAYLHDDILDDGLQTLTDNVEELHVCSQEPITYTEAKTTYTLGNKSAPAVGAPENRSPNGRKVVVSAITDGSITSTGTTTHYALVDNTNTKLLAAGSLTASQAVTSGNPFTLTAIDIGIPDPA